MSKPIRPIRVEGNIAYVPLTKGYEAVIDAADVPLVEGVNWSVALDRNTYYAVRSERVVGDRILIRTHRMHRVLMGVAKDIKVDHRDGDGLNNRRSGPGGNLRIASQAQNARNCCRPSHNTSGIKGVSWSKANCKWESYIRVDRKKKHLGNFLSLEEAAEAYSRASAELHGEFGRAG